MKKALIVLLVIALAVGVSSAADYDDNKKADELDDPGSAVSSSTMVVVVDPADADKLVVEDVGTILVNASGIGDDDNLVVDDADAADDDYARFTANGLEGRSPAEVRSDLGIEANAAADQSAAEVSFSDPDSNYTGTDVDAAIAELFDVINGGVPNASTGKVDWSQLVNVPAGFADGVDATGAGGGIATIKENDAQVGGADQETLDFLGADFDLNESPDTEINVAVASALTRDSEWDTMAEINAASTDTDAVLDTDIGVTVEAYDAATAKTDENETVTGDWTFNNGITVPQSASAQSQRFYEASGDGSNYHDIIAQAFSANRTSTLPDYNIGYLASDQVDPGGDLADDTIDSEHYVAASIDNEHLADDAVDSEEIASGAVDFDHLAADAKFQSLAVADLNDSTTPSVLTTAETTNKVISNYKSSGADHVFTLPTAHANANLIFMVGDEFQVDVEPPSGTAAYLNGTAAATDEHLVDTDDTLGDRMVCYCANINGSLAWMCYSDDFAEATP